MIAQARHLYLFTFRNNWIPVLYFNGIYSWQCSHQIFHITLKSCFGLESFHIFISSLKLFVVTIEIPQYLPLQVYSTYASQQSSILSISTHTILQLPFLTRHHLVISLNNGKQYLHHAFVLSFHHLGALKGLEAL